MAMMGARTSKRAQQRMVPTEGVHLVALLLGPGLPLPDAGVKDVIFSLSFSFSSFPGMLITLLDWMLSMALPKCIKHSLANSTIVPLRLILHRHGKAGCQSL